jgi:hypothetical protein
MSVSAGGRASKAPKVDRGGMLNDRESNGAQPGEQIRTKEQLKEARIRRLQHQQEELKVSKRYCPHQG